VQSGVVVVGQGYVGLPLAMRAVEVGYRVVGFDVDDDRVARLLRGDSYVEDIPSSELQAARSSGRYLPTSAPSSCADFDYAVITVPTPLKEGVPDLSYIEAAARMLGRVVRAGSTVVLESTTYPGTTRELVVPILEEESGLRAGQDFMVGYSPERIDPGNRRWGLVNTPKVVSGVDERSLKSVKAFYDSLVDTTVPVRRTEEAELVKLLENTFRHVNVALVNELAMFAGDLGIDIWEAISAAATKPFGFMKFTPGPGVGGHCLPVDPSYLSWQVKRRVGAPFRFVELANDINDHMPHYVVRRLTLALNRKQRSVNGAEILLVGLAYKPNTSDVRESPALVVAELLLELGAKVKAADPHVSANLVDPRVPLVALDPPQLASVDAVVILTDHDELDWQVLAAHDGYVLDTRCRLSGSNVEHL
jgi:UDP-N-acetyl-D-glucosamine dehydrogenase